MCRSIKYRLFFTFPTLFLLVIGCTRAPKLELEPFALAVRPQNLSSTPEQVWETRLPTPPSALQALDSTHLLVTTHRGELYTLDLVTGKRDSPIRQIFRKGITARLIDASAQRVYIASAWEQQLRAYSVRPGKLIWKRKVPGIIDPMVLTDNHLFAASLSGNITTFDIESGQTVWNTKLHGSIQHGIQFADSVILMLTDKGSLYAFPSTPQTNLIPANDSYPYLWQRDLSVNPDAIYVAGNGRLHIVDSQGDVVCIEATSGQDVFRSPLATPVYSPPLILPDLVLIATAAGGVVALNAEDGSPVWEAQGSGLIKHPLLFTGASSTRHVLAVYARGDLLALEASTGDELWRFEAGEPIEMAALTSDGVVVVFRRNLLRYYRFGSTGR